MAEAPKGERKSELEVARWKRDHPGEEWGFAGAIDRLKRSLPPSIKDMDEQLRKVLGRSVRPPPAPEPPSFRNRLSEMLGPLPRLPQARLLPPGALPARARTGIHLIFRPQSAGDDPPAPLVPASEPLAPEPVTLTPQERKALADGDRQLKRWPKGKFARAHRALLELGATSWDEKREVLVADVTTKLGKTISRRRVSLALDYLKAKAKRDGTVV